MLSPEDAAAFENHYLTCERVIRHVDTYEPGTFRFDSEETVIAEGGMGFTF